MDRDLIAPEIHLPNRPLQTWRETVKLWEGRALGPCCIYSKDDSHTILLEGKAALATFDTFEVAYAVMARAVDNWRSRMSAKPIRKIRKPRPIVAYSKSVYFIGAGATGPIKIGIAEDPQSRLEYLQTGHHEVLSILAVTEGGNEAESRYHHQFSDARIRGEWFTRTPAILAEIARLQPRSEGGV